MAAKPATRAPQNRSDLRRNPRSAVRAGKRLTFYLDASVLLPVLIEEAASAAVDEFLTRKTTDKLLVSEFAAAEVASALSKLVRMAKLETTDALERLADFDVWRTAASATVDMVPADARLANAYARRFELGLRAPDALHAAIASRSGATLVTLDSRLMAAAKALGIAVRRPPAEPQRGAASDIILRKAGRSVMRWV